MEINLPWRWILSIKDALRLIYDSPWLVRVLAAPDCGLITVGSDKFPLPGRWIENLLI